MTWEEIEILRDRTYHRTRQLQVRTMKQVLDFVDEVGFCFAFTAKNSELPCLWHAACGEREPVYPEHTHSDPYIGLVWEAKDILPAEKKIYYGKALKNRPTIISLEYFPYFYALTGRGSSPDAFLAEYMRGEISPDAKRIMEALQENSPQVTADLKLSSRFAHPKKRYAFDRAMAELQMKMHVVKIGEFYDPFTFLWELVTKRFEPEVEKAKAISQEKAREEILAKYFQSRLVSEPLSIQRLFGWERGVIDFALAELVQQGCLRADVSIEGDKKKNFAVPGIVQIGRFA
jgi:hypothetical protein